MRYHVFTLSVGQYSVERKYIPQTDDTGTREAAEKKLKRTQRGRIIGYRFSRPTSENRRLAEEAGHTWPVAVGRTRTRGRS